MESVAPLQQNESLVMSNNEQNPYLIKYSTIVYILTVIQVLYIPLITISSVLVICAVRFISKLNNPHNSLILSVAATDLITGIILIPIYLLLAWPRYGFVNDLGKTICRSKYFDCIFVFMLGDNIELLNLVMLSLLGLDTLLQVMKPLEYKRKITLKKINIFRSIIVALIMCFCVIFYILRKQAKSVEERDQKSTNESSNSNVKQKVDKEYNWGNEAYLAYMMVVSGSLLLFCIVVGVYLQYRLRKLGFDLAGGITPWLLLSFIIFFSPTVIFNLSLKVVDTKISTKLLWRLITQVIRWLSPATNGVLIYFSRPVYQQAFRFFLKTNPMHWKLVENIDALKSRKPSVEPKTIRESVNISTKASKCESKKNIKLSNDSLISLNEKSKTSQSSASQTKRVTPSLSAKNSRVEGDTLGISPSTKTL